MRNLLALLFLAPFSIVAQDDFNGPNPFLLGAPIWKCDTSTFNQDTLHVPGDHSTIQQAINACNNGDLIMLAPGNYQENLSANGKEFGLSSEYLVSCDTMDIYNTVIDGNGGAGLTIALEEHIKVIGLTFTNCNSGIYFQGQNPAWYYDLYFSNLRLINNSSHGINGYLWRTGNYLLNSHIANNGSHGVRSVNKGAFYMGECLIEDNGGHGIFNQQSGFMAAACIIRNNSGDGIYSTYWGSGFISYRCIIHSNSGDGVHSKNSGAQRVYNCTVVNNGEYGLRGTVNSQNSIIYGNTAGVHLIDNGGDPGSQASSSFAYTISESALPGTGNQQDDPQLDLNFTLLPTSPALLAGNPESIAIGSYAPNNSYGYGSYSTGAGMSLGAIQVTDIVEGCTDSTACNFNFEANVENGSCISSGCTEEGACNFTADAGCDDGSCDYSCCPGPGCCAEGTIWDSNSSTCIVANPTDTDLDGCTGVSDVLEVLLYFGQCNNTNDTIAETTWTCGDPVTYWDYDYATVLIGDQCWFAENLRTTTYANGDALALGSTNWTANNEDEIGVALVYGDEGSGCSDGAPDFNSCDPDLALENYGRLYNQFAVQDDRGLCPSGWHVSTEDDIQDLANIAWDYGCPDQVLRSTSGWVEDFWMIPSDALGFGAKPAGSYNNGFNNSGYWTYFWVSVDSSPLLTEINFNDCGMFGWVGYSLNYSDYFGASVRCLRDAD